MKYIKPAIIVLIKAGVTRITPLSSSNINRMRAIKYTTPKWPGHRKRDGHSKNSVTLRNNLPEASLLLLIAFELQNIL